MPDEAQTREFDLYVLNQLEKLFGAEDLETMVHRADVPGDKPDSAVRVVHLPTGKEATSYHFHTQIRNKAACLLTLLLDTPRS